MKAKLKRIDLNSAVLLEQFRPEDPECFGFWLNASIGSDETEGADDFQILVCNREWLERERGKKNPERYVLLDGKYDATLIIELLSQHLDSCTGNSWIEVVAQISKIGVWEFEGYKA
jgi:Immunity protein 8